MKKIAWLLMIALFMVGGLAGCSYFANGDNDQQQEEQQPIDNEDEDGKEEANEKENKEDEKSWDLVKEDTIFIEGMEEDITLNLLDGRANGFITYIPNDFLLETVSSGEGDAYWVYANFGGNKRSDVYIRFYFFPETLEGKPVIVGERSVFADPQLSRIIKNEEKYHSWTIEEYISQDGETWGALGNHQGQYFLVTVGYPLEFGDGMAPRVNKVLENFYWTDTDTYLLEEE